MTRETSKTKVAELPSALENLDEILRTVDSKQLVIFLDYDGTLTPIVGRPEEAVLSPATRLTVQEVAEICTIAILSGRDRKDVQHLVGIDNIYFAGSHGFDIAGPRDERIQNQKGMDFVPVLDEVEEKLRNRLDGIAGALVERKRFSVAIHYRQVKEGEAERVEEVVDQVLGEQNRLRKGYGKKVFELQPDIDWHKGKALLWLLDVLQLKESEVAAMYIGDDVTDEDAFEVIQGLKVGIGVFVKGSDAPQVTAAHYTLEDPEDVRQFLSKLADSVKGFD